MIFDAKYTVAPYFRSRPPADSGHSLSACQHSILYLRGAGSAVRPRRSEPLAVGDGASAARLRGGVYHWQRCDLSTRHYVYIWAVRIYLQEHMEPQAECLPVLTGATPEGANELLAFQVGVGRAYRAGAIC